MAVRGSVSSTLSPYTSVHPMLPSATSLQPLSPRLNILGPATTLQERCGRGTHVSVGGRMRTCTRMCPQAMG